MSIMEQGASVMSRAKSAMSEWKCKQDCGAGFTSHVAGTQSAGHRCPSTLKWSPFKRVWRSKYDSLK